jgi:hypothetical protein
LTECIHGLDAKLCDVCTPKAPPPPVARTVRVAQPRRTAAPKTKNASLPRRRHVVVDIDELAAVLAGETDPGEWASETPLTGFDRVVLVAPVDEVSQVSLIAVANEPARDRVREALGDQHPPRIGVYPPWFDKSF